jgi:hypothetical protein
VDIRNFVEGELQKSAPGPEKDDARKRLMQDVASRADGVFLWVRLVVRALVEALRHKASMAYLQQKLDALPNGLKALFDIMFAEIDPVDRTRSDKLLLIFGPKDRPRDAQNALQVSWLDDLDDPDFPFNAVQRPCSEDEIKTRQETARAQLRVLTKGLLELRPLGSESNVYFQQRVHFFHRTVADYLGDSERQAAMKDRISANFSIKESRQRLRLAELKFAPATEKNLQRMRSDSELRDIFDTTHAFYKVPRTWGPTCEDQTDDEGVFSVKLVQEVEAVLQRHREVVGAPMIEWALAELSGKGGLLRVANRDLSFIHHLTYHNERDPALHRFIMNAATINRGLQRTSEDDLNLTFSAAMALNHTLVHDLLAAGAKPEEEISWEPLSTDAEAEESVPGENIEGLGAKLAMRSHRRTTIWAASLLMLARKLGFVHRVDLSPQGMAWSKQQAAWAFAVTAEFLKFGASRDVFFEFTRDAPDSEGANEASSTEVTKAASASMGVSGAKAAVENHDDKEVVAARFEDIVLLSRPPNMDLLVKLLTRRKESLLWQETKGFLAAALPFMGPSLRPRKPNLDVIDLGHLESILEEKSYKCRAVYVGDHRLEVGVKVRVH